MASSQRASKTEAGTTAGQNIPARKSPGRERRDSHTVQQERDRLAQLLHDTICQELTGVCLMASAAACQHGTAAPQVGEQFKEIADQVQRAGRQLAEIVHGLRNPA